MRYVVCGALAQERERAARGACEWCVLVAACERRVLAAVCERRVRVRGARVRAAAHIAEELDAWERGGARSFSMTRAPRGARREMARGT